MAMEYGETIGVLENLTEENVKEVLEKKSDLISAIKGEVQKKGSAEAGLRVRLKSYEGIDPENYKSTVDVLKNHGWDGESDLNSHLSSLKSVAKPDVSKSTEYVNLKSEFDQMRAERQQEKEETQRLKEQTRRDKIRNTVFKDFNDKFFAADLAVKELIGSGRLTFLDDEETVAYKNKSGDYIADNIADAFAKERPDLVKNTQKPGTDSDPNQYDGKSKTMTKAQFTELSKTNPQMLGPFFADGGKVSN